MFTSLSLELLQVVCSWFFCCRAQKSYFCLCKMLQNGKKAP